MKEANVEKLVAIVCITALVGVAITEGLNGKMVVSGLVAIIAIAAPKQLDKLPFS